LQFYKAASDQLTQAEIIDYIDCNPEPGSDVKLFGLTSEMLERFNPKKLVTAFAIMFYLYITSFSLLLYLLCNG